MIKKFSIQGMTCIACERVITKEVRKIHGVRKISVDYVKQEATVDFDEGKTDYQDIQKAIEDKGYGCSVRGKDAISGNTHNENTNNKNSWLYWVFAGIGIILIAYFAWSFYGTIEIPQVSQNMGLGLLFVVGLLTGFHCVGMCGGFVVSYVAKGAKEGKSPSRMHLSYAAGKLISYTFIGAAFGLLGSIIAFTPMMRGVAGILAGAFLIIFGLKMLDLFPSLRKLSIRMPSFMDRFVSKETKAYKNNPLVIGLLNGLMIACGPLQAIYVMAAGTGDVFEGAKMLFAFGLGTLPVMLGFGYVTSIISKRATHRILKASGVIVIVLGIIMVNRGLALTGTGYDFNSLTTNLFPFAAADNSGSEGARLVPAEGFQEIRMEVNRYGWTPDKFVLKKDVPVRWFINGKELNGCNNAIQVPKLGLNFNIRQGEQMIEFTPTESGTIPWSCWMGMIPGVFIVKDEVDGESIGTELNTVVVPKGGSCGGSCGGSTCGLPGGGGCGCGR